MNRLLVLLLATASIAASGCFGVPEGAAASGSLVTIDFVARDAETGEVVAERQGYRFVVGQGNSGLGDDVDDAVVGHVVNDTFTVRSVDDESRAFREEVRVPLLLGTDPATGEAPIAAFNNTFGHLPVEGEIFPLDNFYDRQVTSVGEENFTFSIYLEGGEERIQVGAVGAVLVSTIEDGQLVQRLEPLEGVVFTVAPPTQQQPNTPLGLEPGTYRTLGADGEDLVYERSPVAFAALAEADVEFEVTVVDVLSFGQEQGELEGDYGARGGSPYLNGDPADVDLGHDHDDGHADDGHADDGHADDGHADDGHADDGHDDHTH